MIENLELKNFTVFEDVSIDFSSGINVIIGENGTGKTHLLKAAYALCASAASFMDTSDSNKHRFGRSDIESWIRNNEHNLKNALSATLKDENNRNSFRDGFTLDTEPAEQKSGMNDIMTDEFKLMLSNNIFTALQNKSDDDEFLEQVKDIYLKHLRSKSNYDDNLDVLLTETLLRLFMPLDDKLGKMHHYGASEQAYLHATLFHDQNIAATFHNNSKALSIMGTTNCEQYKPAPVFIPTKEVLSFMKGFNSLYERYELSFDQTYKDICLLLDLPAMRQDTLHEKSKWAMAEIESICDGRFIFYGGGKVTFKTKDTDTIKSTEHSANAMAEGFRKLGMLSRLLETGALQPGMSGPLFWDEPEANLNPKLMEQLVQILLELSRNGQQIIIATHNYVLLKWFDLLMDKDKEDKVRFHSLYRDSETTEIRVASTDDYLQIDPNPIDDAFAGLIDHEISNDMGDLGK